MAEAALEAAYVAALDGEDRGYAFAPEGTFNLMNFKPQGPVAAEFINDREHLFRAVMGPWGSGKTNLAFMDMFSWAVQAPKCDDGVRRFCALVVRDTYRNLETTLKTWHGWVPKAKGHFTGGGGDRPAKHVLEYTLLDHSTLELVVEFRAIGDLSVEDALLGVEANWAFLNELTTLPFDIITYMLGRLGRYPSAKLLGEDPVRIAARPQRYIADLNAPEQDHILYRYFVEECPPTTRFFRQPGGRDAAAENVTNLPPKYYDNLIAANAKRKWFIRRFVDNEFGYSRAGIPVFEEDYDDSLHVGTFAFDASLPIYLGLDGGMGIHPAATMWQWHPSGHIRGIAELVPGRCLMGRFCELLRAWLAAHAPQAQVAGVWADPAAFRGQNSEQDETSFIFSVAQVVGAPLMPTATNEIAPRLDALRYPLALRIGGVPMLQISAAGMPKMRRAFNSDYRFKVDALGNLTGEAKPDKVHGASDVMDSGGYALLGMIGLEAIMKNSISMARPRIVGQNRPGRRDRDEETFSVAGSWDVYSLR